MSNLFEDVLTNVQEVEDRLLGPSYAYHTNIKTPSQIGMSSKGSMKALGKNVAGLVEYVELMVTGDSRASATGGPLGNKFFLETGAKCRDVTTDSEVRRHIYIDNVPNGNIPFISSGMGVNFSEFKGLIPGAMGNLNALNPFGIMRSFLSGSTPDCQPLTMETIDVNNNSSSETHFVTLADIRGMNSCMFADRQNPVTGQQCRETFVSELAQASPPNSPPPPPYDSLSKLHLAGVSFLYIVILYKLASKGRLT
jgi:hypothetical protein